MSLRRGLALLLVAVLCLGCAACKTEDGAQTEGLSTGAADMDVEKDALFSDRDYQTDASDVTNVMLPETGTYTITKAGAYRITGQLSGQLQVNAGEQDKVHLILDGVSIQNTGSAALYIVAGDKVFVTLAEGTENSLSANGEFQQTDSNTVDAAVFSKSDLTFNGTGSLTVQCEAGHGIVSKDDLKITEGSYHIQAAGQGLSGKDCLHIAGGSFQIKAGTDGLQSKNEENAERGNIYILDGTFDITAGADGMDASRQLGVYGGSFHIFTGEGSASVTHTGGQWGGGRWPGQWEQESETTGSYKGIKAATSLVIAGGTWQVDAQDDGFHSNGDLAVTGGEITVSTGDDGFHADGTLEITAGTVTVSKSYEGLEGNFILISGGSIDVTASDDGLNAAGGNDSSGMGGPWDKGGFSQSQDAGILISGGELLVDAGGDGLDSNGYLTVTGGTVYVDGPTNSGNGALDYAGNASISGGTVIALGAAGMATNFGTSSTQGAILCSASGSTGTVVSIKDSNGTVLASYTARKSFQTAVISAPGMITGETYTITVGTSSQTVTLNSIVTGSGMGGNTQGGNRPGRH